MKNKLTQLAGLALLTGGVIFAQSAATTPRQPAQRMAAYLNLTPDQQAQAKAIRAQAREAAAPIREQLKQSRQALQAAIKSGNDAQIDQITQAQAPLMAQAAAIRAHAFEKFYATLTPDQKAKADSMHQFFKSHRRPAQSNS
ncbi:MAG: Spy/CpxP family protein refolding chaperone [Bryobacteraceae bacterium]|jgi:Spy/CpxP family protein refolding chaperone